MPHLVRAESAAPFTVYSYADSCQTCGVCFFRHTCGAVRLAAQRRAAGAKLAQKDTFPLQSAKPIMM